MDEERAIILDYGFNTEQVDGIEDWANREGVYLEIFHTSDDVNTASHIMWLMTGPLGSISRLLDEWPNAFVIPSGVTWEV